MLKASNWLEAKLGLEVTMGRAPKPIDRSKLDFAITTTQIKKSKFIFVIFDLFIVIYMRFRIV